MTDVAIVVSSFDGFKATWEPFRHGFEKYWPDCPWPVRFLTNNLDAPFGETVKMGDDAGQHGWSRLSRTALETMREDVVLWIHDDNWLTRPVNTDTIVSLVRLFEHDDLHLIRLSNCYLCTTFGNEHKYDARLRAIRPDSKQRCSLQPSLWRRNTLISLLVDGQSPWTFEGNAPNLAREIIDGDFCCCRERFLPLRFLTHVDPDWDEEAVRRGEWTRTAVKYAAQERIYVDFSTHPNGNKNVTVPYDHIR